MTGVAPTISPSTSTISPATPPSGTTLTVWQRHETTSFNLRKVPSTSRQAVKLASTQKRDTVKAVPAPANSDSVNQSLRKDNDQAKPQRKEAQPADVEVKRESKREPAFDSSKYEAMDSRVRTGAYRIIGTAQVVKVKEGETLQRISDRMLGPGMECYIEVYNGIDGTAKLKEGQSLKIPKLELKKKRR